MTDNSVNNDHSLRELVAQTFVIYMKTYALHWNYEGQKFFGVHSMTEAQYEELAAAIDVLAERMRAMGQSTPVSLRQILESSHMRELREASDEQALKDLAKSNRQISQLAASVAEMAEKVGDHYTHDLAVSRIGVHDKHAWMIESFFKAH